MKTRTKTAIKSAQPCWRWLSPARASLRKHHRRYPAYYSARTTMFRRGLHPDRTLPRWKSSRASSSWTTPPCPTRRIKRSQAARRTTAQQAALIDPRVCGGRTSNPARQRGPGTGRSISSLHQGLVLENGAINPSCAQGKKREDLQTRAVEIGARQRQEKQEAEAWAQRNNIDVR